jgi:hypothetical protein
LRAQRQHDLVLQPVGVLIFVDKEMIEAARDLGGDGLNLHHLGEVKEKIVVIEHALALLGFDVPRKERAQILLVRRAPRKMMGQCLGKLGPGVDGARIDGEACPFGRKSLLALGEAQLVPNEIDEIG